MVDGSEWLDAMPAGVSRQRDLLRRLIAAIDAEPAIVGLSLGCSLARGAGDEWSDADAGLAVALDDWPSVVDDVARLVRDIGPAADVLIQPWPFGEHGQARHVFVQYRDGLQLSLLTAPAPWWNGRAVGDVVLYDVAGAFAAERTPATARASGDDVREWAFLGWIALADLVKYVSRGSAWEALARLDDARTQAFRLWAVATGVRYPRFGLTSLLDEPAAGLPPGIDETVAGLDVAALRAAAGRLAGVLADAARRAAAAVPAELPDGMEAHVRGLLNRLPA